MKPNIWIYTVMALFLSVRASPWPTSVADVTANDTLGQILNRQSPPDPFIVLNADVYFKAFNYRQPYMFKDSVHSFLFHALEEASWRVSLLVRSHPSRETKVD